MFYKESGIKSYIIIDLHILGNNMSFGYEDSYNYYDIDVDKILLLKKHDNEYFVRYNDVNKKGIVLSQIKMESFSFGELDILAWDIEDVPAEVDMEVMIEKFLLNIEKYGIKLLN